MTDRSTCLSPFCGTRIPERASRCPRCGRPMFDDGEVGRRGGHVLLLGLILIGVMGAVLWFTAPVLLDAIRGSGASGFRGPPAQAGWMLAAFTSLALMGGAFAVTGFRMLTGRASRATTLAALGLFLLSVGLVVACLTAGGRGLDIVSLGT